MHVFVEVFVVAWNGSSVALNARVMGFICSFEALVDGLLGSVLFNGCEW